jgi:hypothetical protein
VILAAVCGLAIAPFFRWGSPSGHDFEFHVDSWMDVLNQWKQGVVFPRWAEFAHWGYGEARFIFYPPGSWTMGAALGALLPWKMVPGAYCWIVLTAAGMSMYTLAREWLRPADALFAAAFYAVNPYHLLIVYWRSAYAELLAAVVVPLMLLCMLRLKEDGFRPVLWLSLTLASAWLTNDPAAVMIYYSAAGLAVLVAARERSLRTLLRTGVAMALGCGLASFYLLPAVYEQPWVSIAQVLSPGVRPQDNFLFTTLADPDHNRFNLLISLVAIAEIAVLVLAIGYALRRVRMHSSVEKATGMLLAIWGAAAAFVMLPASRLLWEYLPKFRYVQLPFRWLLCLNAALALLLAIATRSPDIDQPAMPGLNSANRGAAIARWTTRGLASAILLAVLLIAGHRIQPPWWDTSADIREMSDAIDDGIGYEGTDEYVPAGTDPSELNKNLPQVSDGERPVAGVEMSDWSATEKHFVARAGTARKLTLRLFNYPAWKVMVNGKPVATETSSVTGLMIVPVAAGNNDVQIHFGRTADGWVGGLVSLISIIVFCLVWMKPRRIQSPAIARIDA